MDNLSTFDTIWPSDSIEFCPQISKNLFVCGTYQLDKPNSELRENTDALEDARPMIQHRRGKCLLFEVVNTPSRKL